MKLKLIGTIIFIFLSSSTFAKCLSENNVYVPSCASELAKYLKYKKIGEFNELLAKIKSHKEGGVKALDDLFPKKGYIYHSQSEFLKYIDDSVINSMYADEYISQHNYNQIESIKLAYEVSFMARHSNDGAKLEEFIYNNRHALAQFDTGILYNLYSYQIFSNDNYENREQKVLDYIKSMGDLEESTYTNFMYDIFEYHADYHNLTSGIMDLLKQSNLDLNTRRQKNDLLVCNLISNHLSYAWEDEEPGDHLIDDFYLLIKDFEELGLVMTSRCANGDSIEKVKKQALIDLKYHIKEANSWRNENNERDNNVYEQRTYKEDTLNYYGEFTVGNSLVDVLVSKSPKCKSDDIYASVKNSVRRLILMADKMRTDGKATSAQTFSNTCKIFVEASKKGYTTSSKDLEKQIKNLVSSFL